MKGRIIIVVILALLVVSLGFNVFLFVRPRELVQSKFSKYINEPSSLVENFPSIPVYPNAQLVTSSCASAKDMLFDATWTTTGDVNEIMSWYDKNLKLDNWQSDLSPEYSGDIQQSEYSRGIPNSWLSRIRIGVIKQDNLVKINASFPAPDSEIEREEE